MDYRAADAVLLAYEQAVKACDEIRLTCPPRSSLHPAR
jgi:hypothetical protein